MNAAYYNEIDPTAVIWLEAAMDAGHIAQGDIDTRSIIDVAPNDLTEYTQCHFFAGIGGWSIALRLAGWPDDRPVWTGSCPCQPFSSAGKRKGQSDKRHLWPVWFNLIKQSMPPAIFGEQVSSAIKFGWLDEVYNDLEGQGYAVGSAVLPACSVGAPHKRDRLWFVGITEHNGLLAATKSGSDAAPIQYHKKGQNLAVKPERASVAKHVANPFQSGLEGYAGDEEDEEGRQAPHGSISAGDSIEWIYCPDEKARPVKSGLCLLADGIPSKLRKASIQGFGNAIVPQVAAEFIRAAACQ